MKITSLENLIAWIRDLFDQYDYANGETQAIKNLRDSADGENFWKIRECIRFEIRDYAHIPDPILEKMREHGIAIDPNHFLHCSTDQPGMIAYTPSADYGIQDRQIRSKFGKYLRSQFGDQLSDHVIADIANSLRGSMDQSLKLLIAETPDDIANVYINGPRSCMDGRDFPRIGEHPSRVYGGRDTAVAYITRDGEITARSVIVKSSKEWIRLYGDEDNLRSVLEDQGYSAGGDLDGCQLLKIENDHGDFIFPYLDGRTTNVDDHGDHFIVTSSGEWDGCTQSGILDDSDRAYCEDCENRYDSEDMHYVESCNRSVCESCLDGNYLYAFTGRYQEWISDQECTYDHNGECYTANGCEWHDLIIIDGEAYSLDDCVSDIDGEWIHIDDAIGCEDSSGETVYVSDSDLVCDDCVSGDPILIDGSTEIMIGVDGTTGRTNAGVSWSNVYDHYIADDDCAELQNGSVVLDSDHDRIDADNDQETFPFYTVEMIAHTDRLITTGRDSAAINGSV